MLLELETDKASVEIARRAPGVLTIAKPEGETVTVGDVVARIDEAGAAAASPPAPAAPPRRRATAPARAGAIASTGSPARRRRGGRSARRSAG